MADEHAELRGTLKGIAITDKNGATWQVKVNRIALTSPLTRSGPLLLSTDDPPSEQNRSA